MPGKWLNYYMYMDYVVLQLTCVEEDLSDGKVNITCESNRVLESLTCSVDNDPPQSCMYVANEVNLYSI